MYVLFLNHIIAFFKCASENGIYLIKRYYSPLITFVILIASEMIYYE